LGALAVVEISFGFAARPQIFTALFLVLELWLLVRIPEGRRRWACGLPVLFAVWVNTHGGVLAGIGLLALTTLASTAQLVLQRASSSAKTISALWLTLIASFAALFCNPWGAGLVRWLVESVLWLRPEIQEWNRTPLGWNHAAFFMLLALTVFAWVFTRREWRWWEIAACAAFALLALRSVRHSPLFCLVALALTPAHLGDALKRFDRFFEQLLLTARTPALQKLATALFVAGSVGIAIATFSLHKEHPLTMEVPRRQYPVAAIQFMKMHGLTGKAVTFFDWGEMMIFHLPECQPSVDGRLDTCYPRELIAAHWKFYNDESFDRTVFNPEEADLALLPSNLAGALSLGRKSGWKAVYFDELSVVLAKESERLPGLRALKLPVQGATSATTGRAPFSHESARWKAN
jgi:hypothetical protein